MAANVLKTDRATAMSVAVVRAFIRLRRISSSHGRIAGILRELEAAVRGRLDRQDKQIAALFGMMMDLIDEIPGTSRVKKRIASA